MAEEYRVFYQHMGDLKKKYSELSVETLEQIFVEGFRSGRQLGFDAGYVKAIGDSESFLYDESTEDFSFDDQLDIMSYGSFDAVDEILES
jgi:hypothetical protein